MAVLALVYLSLVAAAVTMTIGTSRSDALFLVGLILGLSTVGIALVLNLPRFLRVRRPRTATRVPLVIVSVLAIALAIWAFTTGSADSRQILIGQATGFALGYGLLELRSAVLALRATFTPMTGRPL